MRADHASEMATPPGVYKGGEILLEGEDVLKMDKEGLCCRYKR